MSSCYQPVWLILASTVTLPTASGHTEMIGEAEPLRLWLQTITAEYISQLSTITNDMIYLVPLSEGTDLKKKSLIVGLYCSVILTLPKMAASDRLACMFCSTIMQPHGERQVTPSQFARLESLILPESLIYWQTKMLVVIAWASIDGPLQIMCEEMLPAYNMSMNRR